MKEGLILRPVVKKTKNILYYCKMINQS